MRCCWRRRLVCFCGVVRPFTRMFFFLFFLSMKAIYAVVAGSRLFLVTPILSPTQHATGCKYVCPACYISFYFTPHNNFNISNWYYFCSFTSAPPPPPPPLSLPPPLGVARDAYTSWVVMGRLLLPPGGPKTQDKAVKLPPRSAEFLRGCFVRRDRRNNLHVFVEIRVHPCRAGACTHVESCRASILFRRHRNICEKLVVHFV